MIVLAVVIAASAVMSFWVLTVARRRWGCDDYRSAVYEVLARKAPAMPGSATSLRRRLLRRTDDVCQQLPSRRIFAATGILVRLNSGDLSRLVGDAGVETLSAYLSEHYQQTALSNGWAGAAQAPYVVVQIDPALRRGWIPVAKQLSPRLLGHDPSDNTLPAAKPVTGATQPLPLSQKADAGSPVLRRQEASRAVRR